MALSIEEKRERAFKRQVEAQKRARDRQIAKMNDPKWRDEQRAKQIASQNKQFAKQRAKLNDPEYIAKKKTKTKEQIEKARAKPKKPAKKTTSKGLKGRAVNASERRVMDAIGQLPCIACAKHGRDNQLISLHHVYGRTVENAHAYVLPLCAYHHDTLLPANERERYPDMLPLHAKGKYGGKAQFARYNGTELDLLHSAYQQAGLDIGTLKHLS